MTQRFAGDDEKYDIRTTPGTVRSFVANSMPHAALIGRTEVSENFPSLRGVNGSQWCSAVATISFIF